MLAVNNVFNELSTIQTLANELSVYSKSTEYDELGLLKRPISTKMAIRYCRIRIFLMAEIK